MCEINDNGNIVQNEIKEIEEENIVNDGKSEKMEEDSEDNTSESVITPLIIPPVIIPPVVIPSVADMAAVDFDLNGKIEDEFPFFPEYEKEHFFGFARKKSHFGKKRKFNGNQEELVQ